MNSVGSGYIAAQSLANPGYVKFSTGLIIQWGKITDKIQVNTVTLPTAFSSTNYAAIATAYNGAASAGATRDYTETSFEYVLGADRACVWIAIGY